MASTALFTDHYELTMLQSALHSGLASHRSVFEVFARRLPDGRRFGIVGGVGRLAEAVAAFRFGHEEIDFLRANQIVDHATCEFLADFRFSGDISAYGEGEAYFPFSPVLSVRSGFGEGLLLETVLLSILNHDSAVASAAARMVMAAKGRSLIEGGSRRTHEAAAVASARMAYICGFDVTSNLEAARRYGVPSGGTTAHAFVLAHASEAAAFKAQATSFGANTTFLVDTFDIEGGVAAAVVAAQAAGGIPAAIRIDSGDLGDGARAARRQLDGLGAQTTRIIASGDVDEYLIASLSDAPIDTFLVGTQLVTGSGAATPGFVYKLVARADEPGEEAPLVPVAKRSAFKPNAAGQKHAWRNHDDNGHMTAEWFALDALPQGVTSLQQPLVVKGVVQPHPALAELRETAQATLSALPPDARSLEPGPAALTASRQA